MTNLAAYMIKEFKNQKAAIAFLDRYDEAVQILEDFPFGYRGISFEYSMRVERDSRKRL